MLFPLVALALLSAPQPILAGPPGEEVLIECDAIEYGMDENVLRLVGHVTVRRGDGVLHATSGTFDRAHQHLSLEGGVLALQGRQVFLADRADVDLQTRTADLASATLLLKERPASEAAPRAGKNTLTLHGKRVRQIGSGVFEATDVTLTPCDCVGEPDYQLEAKSARIEGDRAALSAVRLDLLGLPIPLFPLSLPLTARQSGLLAPQLGYAGQTGFGYAQPIFWAISQSTDATVTPGFFTGMSRTHNPALGERSLRGPRLGLEYRYAPVQGTSGLISLDLFYDFDQADSPAHPAAFPGEHDIAQGRGFGGVRGVLRAAHRSEGRLGVFALEGAWAGDAMYLSDLQPAGIDRANDILRTDTGFWRARGPLTVGADASLLEDLRTPNGALPDQRLLGPERRSTFQRLPAAFVQLAPVTYGRISFSAEASAAQYVALAGPDARERDTGFGPTDYGVGAATTGWPDPARKPALHLDAAPTVAWSGPRTIPVDLRVEAGARADAWLLESGEGQDRTRLYGLAGARAALPLERTFALGVHRIEPAVEVRALTRPLRGGGDPIGDPADAGGPVWSALPEAAQQGLAPGLAAGVVGVPSARRAYDELDGAAPSTGAVQATFSLAQSLWRRAGRSASRVLQFDLVQDALFWADGMPARIGESGASLAVQAGPGSLSGMVRYDWHTRAITAATGNAGVHDSKGREAHVSATLLRARTASEVVRAGVDELFATVILGVEPGDLSGAGVIGGSMPVPIGRPGLRIGYDAVRFLGFIRSDAPTWSHKLALTLETPCRCAGLSLSVEAPLRDGHLLNGPVVHFTLDLKSLGSFATF